MRIFDYTLKDSERLTEVINLSPQSFVSVYSSNGAAHLLLRFSDINALVGFIREKCIGEFPDDLAIFDKILFYDNIEKLWAGKTFYKLNNRICLQLATTVL